jgi:hypothetical protein
MLDQNHHLLPYLYEKASISSGVLLTSIEVAKGLVQVALGSCAKTYIVIDGVDECSRDDRKEIAGWFQAVTEAVAATKTDSLRCLFISQDDGIARNDFQSLPIIKIKDENREDLKNFATLWHEKLEAKFGELRSNRCHISNIILARAQGKPA